MRMRNKLFGAVFGVSLFAFTAYLLLDTFVIVRKYETVAAAEPIAIVAETVTASSAEQTAEETAVEATAEAAAEATVQASAETAAEAAQTPAPAVSSGDTYLSVSNIVSTDTRYADGNIDVTLTEYRISDTTVYVADVQLASASFLKTAFAQSAYGRNVTAKVSTMASDAGAILAVNGDYYGARQTGYVIREGVLYRSTAAKNAEDLVIWKDGTFSIIRESEVSAEELLQNGAWNVLNFGPALLENGEIAVSQTDEVGRAMASNPRTAIAITDEGHYLFVVSDGRTDESAGLTLYELATFLKTLGAETAYNLDGGGSSTMVFNGNLINNPTTNGSKTKERSVSDIVYIGY